MNATTLFLDPGSESRLVCPACALAYPAGAPVSECESCGALLEVLHPRPADGAAALRSPAPAAALDASGAAGASGVWRYHQLVMPAATDVVSWPEGRTPFVRSEAVRQWTGVADLRIKHEGMNPTGSFKDRGMTAAVTHAVHTGARAIACASTGNTAASLAAYAAIAGLPALVLVPEGKVATGKLAQATAYGATVLLVDGDFDSCLELVRAASRELGVYLANSVNPWRIEGQKTIAWELLGQTGWDSPPDWIALPAGALGNTGALGKALREAHALGALPRVPRILSVQAAGAAPFAQGFEHGFAERVRVHAETVASAIRIGDPASWERGVRAIHETNGAVAAVSDDEILDAKAVIDAAGIGCEPASAASVAGVRALRSRGVIAADATVACILTGHLLKDPDTTIAYHGGSGARANPPVRISADLREIRRLVPSA